MVVKTGWWTIEFTIEPRDCDLEHIAELIKEGYTEGEMTQEYDEEEEE